eukprot:CAMPEP_0179449328 /NCGR_PEP_ID=MMETSP0799-20121207/33308_1 /TAXON_ID=46947 /ORGANISM="Geminigera cryophila, Strain CCMP2564" /LENGTH=133 /DNA_ID=CAMNT_0021242329 /DNA_START=77 /DNA_END=478 /DNA_ORIENTATION=-
MTSSILAARAKVGVGLYFQRSSVSQQGLQVKSIVKGSVADVCGKVFVGDEIIAVNGMSVRADSLAELANKILGETNTSVDCSFHRQLPGHASLQHTATQCDELQQTAPSSSDSSSSIFTVSLVRGIATPSVRV